MDGATHALLALWDVAGDAVDRMSPADWFRPTPGPQGDVGDLVAHLAGIHYAGPDRLRSSLAEARHRMATQLAASTAGDRLLGAHCLDLCLHAHDLTTALGDPVDLADHAPAALEACRLVIDVAPRLLVAALGPREATLRLVVRTPGESADRGGRPRPTGALERTFHVVGGRSTAATEPPEAVPDAIEIDAGALLLLLAGRRRAEALALDGAMSWSGSAADAFVHRAQLVG
jgi:hypothetical protein